MQIRKRKVEYIEISYKPHQEEKVMKYISDGGYKITDSYKYNFGKGPFTINAERQVK